MTRRASCGSNRAPVRTPKTRASSIRVQDLVRWPQGLQLAILQHDQPVTAQCLVEVTHLDHDREAKVGAEIKDRQVMANVEMIVRFIQPKKLRALR